MPQDKESGAAANAFGRHAAVVVAREIGATLDGRVSNKAKFEKSNVVIKCARSNTGSIGVTFKMQAELDKVVAAFETELNRYEIFSLPIKDFVAHQRQSRSGGQCTHQVGQVTKAVFLKFGKFIQALSNPAGDA